MVVPTVALLYLFCFIDRANIGGHAAASISTGGLVMVWLTEL